MDNCGFVLFIRAFFCIIFFFVLQHIMACVICAFMVLLLSQNISIYVDNLCFTKVGMEGACVLKKVGLIG